MSQDLRPGDFLVFQLESGFGLLRLLAKTGSSGDVVWHLEAYEDLFFDVDSAEAATANKPGLTVSHPHLALTNRAFESTQVARIANTPLTDEETQRLESWQNGSDSEVSDRSVRLMLGLR
jgi:hypothetical protein